MINDALAPLLAVYGGTFDPVHYGHLRPVEALAQLAQLSRVIIMPNNVPPHRPQPVANSLQRKEMVALAIADRPLFELDERELRRSTPSYTVDTLNAIRQEKGARQPLAFIIGQDSLLTLPQWHQYQRLPQLCHLLVCRRPGYALTMSQPEHQVWLNQHLTQDIHELHRRPAGCIYLADTPLWDISATLIRQRLEQHQTCDDLLPPAVADYIQRQGLYQHTANA
ncbi:nicotinate-nucleotide adenylyltransferase [Apirhabdus apintestini]|uniref:nicotinate-nucleotide adenylyltransferase n=1 Tax=Erwinia sp. HR93 TaxID=3094840 RepID=UPI002ADEEBF2|nr:nicotinate-nucleotide adenylyltransferase [Erwinia sp. HR93]MEA1064412.1 nicotinate-nucleotide adenylyltransferase [Erwinia sp. HR93]WPM83895.1 nicotinate-nucleotide adenylyltransferase [Enterobacteriaceae bacterium CA-0114]